MTLLLLISAFMLGWLVLVSIAFFAIAGFQDAMFWTLAATSVFAAVGVIVLQDLFKAALSLVLTFLAVAGLFVLLNAEFLAVVQVLIYVGAISILIIFAVLLTKDVEYGNPSNKLQIPGLVVAALSLAALTFVVLRTDWVLLEDAIPAGTMVKVEEVFTQTPQWIAGLLLREWVLPFEVASVLLLAAILGALVLMRENEA